MRRIFLSGVFLCVFFSIAGSAYALTALENVGGMIYRDTNLSVNFNQSCMTCHHPSAGFADPANSNDPVGLPVSEGSITGRFGGRNAPSAAYAGFSPTFHWDGNLGSYVGGMFWDGRATGGELGDPLAEQARGPFQNPVEMGLTPAEVVARVSTANYAGDFMSVFPQTDWNDVTSTYNNIAGAIAAFERSNSVTRFSSKFDQFWKACKKAHIDVSAIGVTIDPTKVPQNILSTGQLRGLALFNTKGRCAVCHSSSDYENNVTAALFTDFSYDNLGIPTNPRVEELSGVAPPDLGLGGRLNDAGENGKFKAPTLRNTAKSAPYGHNGYFATLEDIINFYNTRDVPGSKWYGIAPEVPENINRINMGDLGLTAQEEQWIAAFLRSLTDQGR